MTTNCPTCGEPLENFCDCNIQTRGGGALPRTVAEIASLTARSKPNQSSPAAADALREAAPRTDELAYRIYTNLQDACADWFKLATNLETELAGHASRDAEIAGLKAQIARLRIMPSDVPDGYSALRAEVETLRKERDAEKERRQELETILDDANTDYAVLTAQLSEAKAEITECVERIRTEEARADGVGNRLAKERAEADCKRIRLERDTLSTQISDAKAENAAWLEFFESNTALDDLAIDHPDHEAGVSRVVVAADALAKFNVSRRFIRDAMNFAEREETERVSALTSAQTLAGELAGALEELLAQVKGECPCLLNEDSGGDARLDCQIDDALARYRAQQRPTEKEVE